MTDNYPVNLERDGEEGLLITWSNGVKRRYALRELRDNCPCATCREKRSAAPQALTAKSLPIVSAAEAQPLRIADMKPVGSYAYSIVFSDGHDTGIYTLEFLETLGSEAS